MCDLVVQTTLCHCLRTCPVDFHSHEVRHGILMWLGSRLFSHVVALSYSRVLLPRVLVWKPLCAIVFRVPVL